MTEPFDEKDLEILEQIKNTSDRLVEDQLRNVELMEQLSSIPDIEDQIEQVVKTISPDEQSMQTIYNLIEEDLASVLSEVFVESFTIRPTGSRVSGLQLHSSDLDMNIYFEKRPCKARKCTYRVAAALSESVLFDNVVNLSQPRIPIVKCVHKETGLKCDINFSFLSGFENDQLIKNYLSVDNKLRSVMLVIKYWAQLHELTGKERGFSKYALTMMFIFYLQHEHSFPSVYELQENTVPTNPTIIWNMNFAHIEETSDKIKEIHSKSMFSLLFGFFSYYEDFLYDSYVICPYFGKPIFPVFLVDHNLCQKRFHRHTRQLKQVKQFTTKRPICVQDPLELGRNVTSMDELNLSRFVVQCSTAREILRKGGNMMIDLLSPIQELKEYFDVYLYMTTSSVQHHNQLLKAKDALVSTFDLRDIWFTRTINFCTLVFQRILGLKIESEGHFRNNHSYTVSSKRQPWRSQDVDMKIIEEKLKVCTIDSEEDLWNNSCVESCSSCSDEPEFRCSVMLTSNTTLSCVEVEFFRNGCDKDMFSTFASYTCRNLLKWFYKYENYMPEYSE